MLGYGLEWPITYYYYLIMRTYSTNDIISLENALGSDSTSPIVFRDAIDRSESVSFRNPSDSNQHSDRQMRASEIVLFIRKEAPMQNM